MASIKVPKVDRPNCRCDEIRLEMARGAIFGGAARSGFGGALPYVFGRDTPNGDEP